MAAVEGGAAVEAGAVTAAVVAQVALAVPPAAQARSQSRQEASARAPRAACRHRARSVPAARRSAPPRSRGPRLRANGIARSCLQGTSPTERVLERENSGRSGSRWVAALAGGRAPAASLASYSAFPHTRPTERLTPFLPSVPSLLPFFLIRGRRSASHFLTSVLPFLLKLRLGISKLVGESVFSHSVTHAERSSSGGY